jgi:hypothetical protein
MILKKCENLPLIVWNVAMMSPVKNISLTQENDGVSNDMMAASSNFQNGGHSMYPFSFGNFHNNFFSTNFQVIFF